MSETAIYETRKLHLRNLVDGRFGGSESKLAEAIGRQPDYISQHRGGSKKIDEALARYIEHTLSIPTGTLDAPPPTPPAQRSPKPDRQLAPQRSVEDYLDSMKAISQETESFVNGLSFNDFKLDSRTQKAVTMSIIEMGASIDSIAASEPELIANNNSPLWGIAQDLRNTVALSPLDVDPYATWLAATITLPSLSNQASNLLDDLASDPGLSPN